MNSNHNIKSSGQLRLPIDWFRESDRNFDKGGRSFYFFDFDDNVMHLPTKIVLFHKETGEERHVSTGEYAEYSKQIKIEPSEFIVNPDEVIGSFRNFREQDQEKLGSTQQPFIADLIEALSHPLLEWRGPSWKFFVHAVNNARPVSIITARGHHPHTLQKAIDVLVQSRDLEMSPNYLSLYPISHPETRAMLGDQSRTLSVAELKKRAIRAAVYDAFKCYGLNPHHRFGMSDDDPHNVELITDAMRELKVEFPENAFFVFNTHNGGFVREEISFNKTETQVLSPPKQLNLL